MDPQDLTLAVFIFFFGTCVGSFLNVVVYRIPLGLSVVTPPSACPKCGHKLAAFDNVPILGWLWLRGKCRYCGNPISPRYPIVEFITGCLFLAHYILLFHFGWGPYASETTTTMYSTSQQSFHTLVLPGDWPVLVLHLWLIGSLLAASLIDWQHYMIPIEISWITTAVGVVGHAFLRAPGTLGSLHFSPAVDAATFGAAIGLVIALMLLRYRLIKRSFEDDAPLLEKDIATLPEDQRPDPWPPARIRAEMLREILFLLVPVTFAAVCVVLDLGAPRIGSIWASIAAEPHISGALGSLFGAFIGAIVVWGFRVFGSIAFGREAMGLGDIHLMMGVGAIVGPGGATVAFFLAPAFALAIAVIRLLASGKREIPFGPYLSLATYAVLLFYTPMSDYLAPGFEGLGWTIHSLFGGSFP